MKTVAIDQTIYQGAELYALQNNISVQSIIEQGIILFLNKAQSPVKRIPHVSYKEALDFVSTLSAKGGQQVPSDEDGSDARTEKYLL